MTVSDNREHHPSGESRYDCRFQVELTDIEGTPESPPTQATNRTQSPLFLEFCTDHEQPGFALEDRRSYRKHESEVGATTDKVLDCTFPRQGPSASAEAETA
jgi:hypothetical protein